MGNRSLTNDQRKALRKRKQETGHSLRKLGAWFTAEFDRAVSKSTLSETLSYRFAHLDGEYLDPEKEIRNGKQMRNSKPRWPLLDQLLLEWVLGQESLNKKTSNQRLLDAAMEIWSLLPSQAKINPKTGKEYNDPEFSSGFIDRFKDRYDIKPRKPRNHTRSVLDSADEQISMIRRVINGYRPDQVYCMDQFGLYWRRGPSVDLSKVPCAGVNAEKSRLNITLCTNADGSDKLPVHFIGKAPGPQFQTLISQGGASVVSGAEQPKKWAWKSNNVAWMTGELAEEWLQEFIQHVNGKSVVLLLDDVSAYKVAVFKTKFPLNVRVEFLPVRSTNIYQPLDQGIIYSAKECYLKYLLQEQLSAYQATAHVESVGIQPKLGKPRISTGNAVEWFEKVWREEVDAEAIQNCFYRSTLFDENAQKHEFTVPEPPGDLAKLYDEVVSLGKIKNPVDLGAFIVPWGEDDPPFSVTPTIAELVAGQCPVSQEDVLSEQIEVIERPGKDQWVEGIRCVDTLLYLLDHTPENSQEIKHHLRRAVRVFRKKAQQATEAGS